MTAAASQNLRSDFGTAELYISSSQDLELNYSFSQTLTQSTSITCG